MHYRDLINSFLLHVGQPGSRSPSKRRMNKNEALDVLKQLNKYLHKDEDEVYRALQRKRKGKNDLLIEDDDTHLFTTLESLTKRQSTRDDDGNSNQNANKFGEDEDGSGNKNTKRQSGRGSAILTQETGQVVESPFGHDQNPSLNPRNSFREGPKNGVSGDKIRGSIRFDPNSIQSQEKSPPQRNRSPPNMHIEDVLVYNFIPEKEVKQKPFHDRLRSRQELMGILLKHCPEQLGIDMNSVYSKPANDEPLVKPNTGPRFSILQQPIVRGFGKRASQASIGPNSGPPKKNSIIYSKLNI